MLFTAISRSWKVKGGGQHDEETQGGGGEGGLEWVRVAGGYDQCESVRENGYCALALVVCFGGLF